MSKYPPEALEAENLAACIDDHGKKFTELENLLINDERTSVFILLDRIDKLEVQLKTVTELHLGLIEENTAQIGMLTKLLKPWKLSQWLAKIGL